MGNEGNGNYRAAVKINAFVAIVVMTIVREIIYERNKNEPWRAFLLLLFPSRS